MLVMLCFAFALVLFVLAGLGVPSPPRFNLMAFGLALLTAAFMLLNRESLG